MPQEMAKAGEGDLVPSAPLADLILGHPLVASLHRPSRPGQEVVGKGTRGRRIFRRRDDMHIASYLSPRTFATALLDLFVQDKPGKTNLGQVKEAVEKLDENIPGRAALLALIRDAEGDIERFRAAMEHWYNEQMERVSG